MDKQFKEDIQMMVLGCILGLLALWILLTA